jgi:hypothetical protein
VDAGDVEARSIVGHDVAVGSAVVHADRIRTDRSGAGRIAGYWTEAASTHCWPSHCR